MAENRSLDGADNNIANPTWGVGPSLYTRLDYGSAYPTGNAYADGIGAPARPSGTNVRVISNVLSKQSEVVPEPLGFNDMAAWWLFHVHLDIALGGQGEDSVPIAVPLGDDPFDLAGTGTEEIAFRRSLSTVELGGSTETREIFTFPTAYLDADPIYQRDLAGNLAVRSGSGGLMELQQAANGEDVLPSVAYIQSIKPGSLPDLPPFVATTFAPFPGGVAIQTMLVREHNRIARALDALQPGRKTVVDLPVDPKADPEAYDEALFQLARKILEAELQAITYDEVLPAIGVNIPPYEGYDPDLFPATSLEFAGGPLRLETMLNRFAPRLDADGASIPSGPVDSTAVLQPGGTYPEYLQEGMDPILRGMLVTPARQYDLLLDEGLRSADPEQFFGVAGDLNDLMATHINRGRDRGLPAYDKIRSALGLSPVTRFADITNDTQLQVDLASVYSSVSDIDPIVGMLAEDRVAGSLFGPTALALYEAQFTTVRDADRFWYQHAMEHSPRLRNAMRWVGLEIDDGSGPWVLARTLAGLILDTTSLGGPSDVVHLDEDSSALYVQ
jgi:hypothetical protein